MKNQKMPAKHIRFTQFDVTALIFEHENDFVHGKIDHLSKNSYQLELSLVESKQNEPP